jgi:beta-glucosidase
MEYRFPKNFMWGAAVAAHQVEGGNTNNFTIWEKKYAKYLAKTAKQRLWWNPNIKFFEKEISNPQNYISGQAVNHYELYKKDFQLLKELNLNTFRFSIEWSRIEPEKGVFNQKEIEYYREYIKELRKLGIEPIVTLWHWTMPIWLCTDENKNIPKEFNKYFVRFVSKMVGEYKDLVKYWITLNEPETILFGYLNDTWMFKNKSLIFGYIEYLKLAHSHNLASKEIKRIDPNALVSTASHIVYVQPKTKSLIDRFGASFINFFKNHLFIQLIKNNIDFIGMNNYFRTQIHNFKQENENKVVSDFGFELYPQSLGRSVLEMKKYNLPILITEHGLADRNDKYREWYIKESLKGLYEAINEGANIIGYVHWSLLDNFEWSSGFWPRFGLVEVNRDTMERKIRKSAYKYAKIAKENGF